MRRTAAVLLFLAGCSIERDRDLPPSDHKVHPEGILDPTHAEFHGGLLARVGWDFGVCADCHGEDLEGGAARVACSSCHEGGATACATCHDDLGENGAHAAHAPDGVSDLERCNGCHAVPSAWDDPGHLLGEDGRAEVALSGLAGHPGDGREGDPAFDPETMRCANVYCHGDTLGDASAALTEPAWDHAGQGEADCGTCHGLPPSDHARDECASCHSRAIDDGGEPVAALHIDGAVSIGFHDDGCLGCHGNGGDPAPPADLDGDVSPRDREVGAHVAHLEATHRIAAPIACTECHVIPSSPTETGHLDSALPAEVTFGPLASTGGASPRYDAETGRCSDVTCHGGSRSTPLWTGGTAETIGCGSCHDVPPADASHDMAWTLRECSRCHASTDAFGGIVVDPVTGASDHMNGAVDAL